MRVISFDDSQDSKDRFSVLWEGWLAGTQDLRGLGNLRTGAKVMDALEIISGSTDPATGITRQLKPEGGDLYLEEVEWAMLKAAVESVGWRPLAVKRALAAIEALDKAPTVARPGSA